jgi:hypothetical protein
LNAIRSLEAELAKADAQAQRLRNSLNQAISARTVEQENASAEDKINRKYDTQIDRAARAADASKKSQDALRAEIRTINEAREAELKRYRETQRASRSNGTSNSSSANIGDMTALIKQLFPEARITSTTSGKHTKGSDHYAGRAIDFVVPGMMNEAGTIMVRQILQAAGVEIRRNARGTEQFFGPGRGAKSPNDHSDHFHVAWSGRASPETAKRAADTEERRHQAYSNELAALMADDLAAQRALTETAEEQAKLRLDEVKNEQDAYNNNLDSRVKTGKLRQEEADELRRINDETAKYKAELIKRNEAIRQFRMDEAQRQRDEKYDSAVRGDAADVLQGQANLARTLDERNDIERQLVDLKYKEEKAVNDAAIAAAAIAENKRKEGVISAEELKIAQDRAKIAKLRNDSIDQRKGGDLKAIDESNPIDDYIRRISDTKTRVEEATVRELQAVNDGITDALTKQLGIKNQFVKDLFSIFLDEVIFRPLAESLNKGSSGGSPIGAFFSSIFGGIFGRASGGYAGPGSIHRVNEHAGGVELLRMGPQGGTIIPLGQVNARAAGGGGQTVIQQTVNVDARGVNPQGFANHIVAEVRKETVNIVAQASNATLKAVPGRMASYQRDGT